MGNASVKIDANPSSLDLKSPAHPHKGNFKSIRYVSKQSSFEVSGQNSVLPSRSLGSSFTSQKSDSFLSFTRPWSRISGKKLNEKATNNSLRLSKTSWPVPYFESLFQPEFKIRDKISEDSFSVIEIISTGAFSKVYKVVKKDDNKIYAMKILSKAQIVASHLINQVKQEVQIQKVVGHNPFIVMCPYHWQSRKKLFIISEYITGGELFSLLEKKGNLPLEILKIYVAELALALDFLHNAGIIYRDLKLENILLNDRGHIQLTDFGLSKWLKYGMRTNTICGTLQYVAPEILQQKPYGHAVDWWSLGIVVVYMSTGESPYECCLDDDGCVRTIPQLDLREEVRDLTNRLLVEDPIQRLRSLTALKRTALFLGFNFDQVLNCIVNLDDLSILNKKTRHRRRPFSLEEKIRDGRGTTTATGATTTGEATEDRCCRICFDDKKKETAITPCRCKGTIGVVHMSCLEKWLSMSNTHSCELCGYNFQTLRTPKYRVLYSIYYWVFLDRNPQYHRGLKSDFIVFIVLTPMALIGIYACIVAADFYSKEPSKYSPASRWTTISLLIMVVLLTFAYYLWVAVTMRFHMRIWYIWWQANNIVKVMPRDPNSNSLERFPLSGQSSESRHSARRSIREPTESRTNSLREMQTSTPTTQELSMDNHPSVINP